MHPFHYRLRELINLVLGGKITFDSVVERWKFAVLGKRAVENGLEEVLAGRVECVLDF